MGLQLVALVKGHRPPARWAAAICLHPGLPRLLSLTKSM